MRQALLAVALLSACSAQKNLPLGANRASAPLPEASELLESLARRRASVLRIRGLARTSYSAPENSLRSKQFLTAARPDRLRIEVLSPFSTVFVVVTRDGTLTAYDPGEKTVYRGAASVENLASYIQVALPIDVIVDALMATPRMHAGHSGVVSLDDGLLELWQDVENDIRVTWFDQLHQPLRYERRDATGNVLLRVNYPPYDLETGASVPLSVDLELPQDKRRIEIQLIDVDVNPPLDEAVFTLDTPPGSREVALDPAPW
jgi:outer membrane lipoprotein-sorting protein